MEETNLYVSNTIKNIWMDVNLNFFFKVELNYFQKNFFSEKNFFLIVSYLKIYIDGPYSTETRRIFDSEQVILIAAG